MSTSSKIHSYKDLQKAYDGTIALEYPQGKPSCTFYAKGSQQKLYVYISDDIKDLDPVLIEVAVVDKLSKKSISPDFQNSTVYGGSYGKKQIKDFTHILSLTVEGFDC